MLSITTIKRHQKSVAVTAVAIWFAICFAADQLPNKGMWSWLPGTLIGSALLLGYTVWVLVYRHRHPDSPEDRRVERTEFFTSLGYLALAALISAPIIWIVSRLP